VLCDLHELGETCNQKRVARLMRAHKLVAHRGYRSHRHRYSKPDVAAPNHLQQNFVTQQPNVAWVTDITYIRTMQGWLYLAVVTNQATDLTADVLINASPIGMNSDQECSFTESAISRAALVVDATSPKWMTKLKQIAEKFNIPSIDGKTLAQAQGDSIVRFFWTD
jgi:transposase InsO family protein